MIKKPCLKRKAFYWDKTCLQAKRLIRNRRYKKASELGGFFAKNGTGGRTRTDTLLKATDFESVMSTNSITPAC